MRTISAMRKELIIRTKRGKEASLSSAEYVIRGDMAQLLDWAERARAMLLWQLSEFGTNYPAKKFNETLKLLGECRLTK